MHLANCPHAYISDMSITSETFVFCICAGLLHCVVYFVLCLSRVSKYIQRTMSTKSPPNLHDTTIAV